MTRESRHQQRFTYGEFQRWVLLLGALLVVLFGMTLARAHAQESTATIEPSSDFQEGDSHSAPTVTGPVAPHGSSSVGAMHSQQASNVESSRSLLDTYSMNYFSIFDGPSVGKPTKYQPKPNGNGDDLSRPVLLRNFLTGGFDVDDQLSVSATGYWATEAVGESLVMRDPFLRVSHNSLFSTDRVNLYGDFRLHMPISQQSRYNDMMTGIQAFQILSYQEPSSRFTWSTYTSSRLNVFGTQGVGNDLEFYLGPNVSYQVSPSVAATLLYEMRAAHVYGKEAFHFDNQGTDLEPGVSWNITPDLNVNPYLNFYTGDQISLNTTAVGLMLYWKFI